MPQKPKTKSGYLSLYIQTAKHFSDKSSFPQFPSDSLLVFQLKHRFLYSCYQDRLANTALPRAQPENQTHSATQSYWMTQIAQPWDDSRTWDFLSHSKASSPAETWLTASAVFFSELAGYFSMSALFCPGEKGRERKLKKEHTLTNQRLMPATRLSPVSELHTLYFQLPLPLHLACDKEVISMLRSTKIPHFWGSQTDRLAL